MNEETEDSLGITVQLVELFRLAHSVHEVRLQWLSPTSHPIYPGCDRSDPDIKNSRAAEWGPSVVCEQLANCIPPIARKPSDAIRTRSALSVSKMLSSRQILMDWTEVEVEKRT